MSIPDGFLLVLLIYSIFEIEKIDLKARGVYERIGRLKGTVIAKT